MLGIKMSAWGWIIFGAIAMTIGGIMIGYGWHIMPKKSNLVENRKQKIKETDAKQIKTKTLHDLFLEDFDKTKMLGEYHLTKKDKVV